jgi:hypothetical protein
MRGRLVRLAASVLFLLAFVPRVLADTSTSSTSTYTASTTTTITGYAVPNSATLGYALMPFILPIATMSLFILLTGFMDLTGELNSFVIKLGFFIGCLLGMLSLSAVSPTFIPIAFPVVAGVYLLTYVWKRV